MDKNFSIKKTFGLAVLLKLTKTHVAGIEITERLGMLRSNVNMTAMNNAVEKTMAAHNIRLVTHG